MNSLKAICTATLLALVLSVPVYAGDINTPGSPCPTPSPSQVTEPITPDSDATELDDTSSSWIPDLLVGLLSLF